MVQIDPIQPGPCVRPATGVAIDPIVAPPGTVPFGDFLLAENQRAGRSQETTPARVAREPDVFVRTADTPADTLPRIGDVAPLPEPAGDPVPADRRIETRYRVARFDPIGKLIDAVI